MPVEGQEIMCSTPFGICDEDIGWPPRTRSFSGSAQRLSASVMKTSAGKAIAGVKLSCSTPFGICDEDIPVVGLAAGASAGAQRLSASVMKT